MQLSRVLILAIVAMSGLGVIVPSSEAVGQTLNEQLVGAWTYVSVDTVRPDGSRTPMYGPNPQGLVIFDGHGHYALVNTRAGQPKFTSNDRMKGTAVENEAVVHGSIAHFGRYIVNEADKTITFHIETSTFPNWNGGRTETTIHAYGRRAEVDDPHCIGRRLGRSCTETSQVSAVRPVVHRGLTLRSTGRAGT